MATVHHPPDDQALRLLLLGQLPRADAVAVAHFLEKHAEHRQRLKALLSESGDQFHIPRDAAPEVARLLEALRQQVLSPGTVQGDPARHPNLTPADAIAGLDKDPANVAERLLPLLRPAKEPSEIGRLGGYRLLGVLGSGGMGMVFEAEDPRLGRHLALKVMLPQVADNSTARRRFLREARAAAQLEHDNIIPVFQVGEDNGVPFLAMPLLRGKSLDDILKRTPQLALAQVLRIGKQTAQALAAAHAAGLVHRDIKPSNVWIEPVAGGRVKVLDFGLARQSGHGQLTHSGYIVGTPTYMAPEQAQGEAVDGRADLFSLGCVLYRMTTGEPPFKGHNMMALLMAIAQDQPVPPAQLNQAIPAALSDLTLRLLAKNPTDRPASAGAVVAELARLEKQIADATVPVAVAMPSAIPLESPLDTETVAAFPGAKTRRRRTGKRWRLWAAALLGVLAVAVVVIVLGPAHQQGTPENAASAPMVPPGPLLGLPIVPQALVSAPPKLPGVRSWTIETRSVRGSSPVVAFTPDGRRLAVGDSEGAIRVWEAESGKLVQVLLGHESGVISLGWSPDGRTLASRDGMEGGLRLWDAETGRLLHRLEAAPKYSGPLFWLADNRTVALIGSPVSFWDTASGKLIRNAPLPGSGLLATLTVVSPDGQLLAAPHSDKTVRIWSVQTGKETGSFKHGHSKVSRLFWSPDGTRLALVGGAEGVHVWEAATGKQVFHYPEKSETFAVVAWSPNGKRLALSAGGNTGAILLDIGANPKPCTLKETPTSALAWSADGKRIARTGSFHSSGSVAVYETGTGDRLRRLSASQPILTNLAWSPDGQVLLTNTHGSGTQLLAADTGQLQVKLSDASSWAAWAPDGKQLAVVDPAGKSLLLVNPAGKVLRRIPAEKGDIGRVFWSPNGHWLAWTSADLTVSFWDSNKGELAHQIGPYPGLVRYPLQWSPEGRTLAFNVKDVGWHLWDVEHRKFVNDPKLWACVAMVFAPDGKRVAALTEAAGPVVIRRLATGEQLSSLGVAGGRSTPLLWSPDSRLLSVQGTQIDLWDSAAARRLRTLEGRCLPYIERHAWSPDGKLIAGFFGLTGIVWEADTGRRRGALLPAVEGLAISADGHYRGGPALEKEIVMVVHKDDGTTEVLEPAEFRLKYQRKNDPGRLHLLRQLAPPRE